MTIVRILTCGGLLALAVCTAPAAFASSAYGQDYAPQGFNADGASAIGRARQHFDRAEYERNRGNPGAQFILKQKRRNLCRNNPEIC